VSIRVDIVRAWPHRHESLRLELPDGATVGDALAASGWDSDGDCAGLAVFGVRATRAQALADGDRVEVLRGLRADPKDARRRRAANRGA
jgi:putative ubiquitin-RnfH superfamily antitoxin RatB of RatAB toxin-antitoxin module